MFDVCGGRHTEVLHWKLSEHRALIKLQVSMVRERLSENMGVLLIGVYRSMLRTSVLPGSCGPCLGKSFVNPGRVTSSPDVQLEQTSATG